MIYLIGLSHDIQYIANKHEKPKFAEVKNKVTELRNYLTTEIKRLSITLIAEEFCEQALKECNGSRTVAQEVANTLNLQHRFCDPNRDERTKLGLTLEMYDIDLIASNLGIKSSADKWTEKEKDDVGKVKRKYFPIRENFWLEKIQNDTDKDIIFICGDEHIKTFPTLLENNNLRFTILSKGWGMEIKAVDCEDEDLEPSWT